MPAPPPPAPRPPRAAACAGHSQEGQERAGRLRQLRKLGVIRSSVKRRSASVASHGVLESEGCAWGKTRHAGRAGKGARERYTTRGSGEERRNEKRFHSAPFSRPAPMSALTTLRTRAASLASRAAAAADPAVKAASAEYEKLIAANAAYVVKDPAAADKLFKQLVFTKLAR